MQDQEIIQEFLNESCENLARLDRELVELESHPGDADLLGSIFRTIHTIKGTCGFLGFSNLERISHEAETLLSQLRAGERSLTPELVSLILETVDAARRILAEVAATGAEGDSAFASLVERLHSAAENAEIDKAGPAAAPNPPATEQIAAAEAPPDDSERRRAVVADTNIRVGVGLLDKLMDLVGELVLTRNQILQFNSDREDPALSATSQRLNLITSELQDGVMKTRLQPIGIVWNSLPRVVRDIAVGLGKKIRLEMTGADTELDRTIIEAIKDPLVHLVRNACDHGIESPEIRARTGKPPEGKLSLRAWHEGGQVNIQIGDDGAGIDVALLKQKAIDGGFMRPEQVEKLTERETLNLIFHPGLSTADRVSNLSGRGVGMDVVRSHIEKIGGVIDISSARGEGTCFKLRIPLTLAIIPGLVVTSAGERFVIPQSSLSELIRVKSDSEATIECIGGAKVYRRRGKLLPIAYLNQVLGLAAAADAEAANIVVLQTEQQQFGLIVDGINDTQEIVVKPLGKQLKGLNVYAGATIMGDGRVALILDVNGVGQRSGVLQAREEQARDTAAHASHDASQQQRFLLFSAGSFERLAVPLSLVARLEEFSRKSIEFAGACKVVQYRGQILPLIDLHDVIEPDATKSQVESDPVPVIVFNDDERNVGVVVDRIIDVAEHALTVRQESRRPGLLGSAVVGDRVTDFIDLGYVLRSGAAWQRPRARRQEQKRILVAEASAFTRGLIRSGLDMAGYSVLEAGTVNEAIQGLDQKVDLVLAGIDLPQGGYSGLLKRMREQTTWEHIPVFALGDDTAGEDGSSGIAGALSRFDREGMLESLSRLASAVAGSTAGLHRNTADPVAAESEANRCRQKL